MAELPQLLVKCKVSGAPWQASWFWAVFAIDSVPVAVTAWPFPFGKVWLTVRFGIVKSLITQALWAASVVTLSRWISLTRWEPDEGLSTVKLTVVLVPGKSEVPVVPWIVTAELVPTVAEPVPEPVEVKYAIATPAATIAPTAPSATSARRFLLFNMANLLFRGSSRASLATRGHPPRSELATGWNESDNSQ